MTTKYITIDVWQPQREPIIAVQHEKDGRGVQITLVGNGQPVDISSASVQFYAVKPDGEIIYNACTVIDATRGKIMYVLTGQTCAIPGDLRCWIEIIKDGDTLRTQEFKVTVLPSEDDSEAIESTSEFTALEDALSAIEAGGMLKTVYDPQNKEQDIFDYAAPKSHVHTKSQITDFPATMPPDTHTHTKSQVTDFAHTHGIGDIDNFAFDVIKLSSGTNANDVKKSGIYGLYTGVNTPTTGIGVLVVDAYTQDWLIQHWYPVDANSAMSQPYIRKFHSGSIWTAWVQATPIYSTTAPAGVEGAIWLKPV